MDLEKFCDPTHSGRSEKSIIVVVFHIVGTVEGQLEEGLYGKFIVNFPFMIGGTVRNLQSSSRPCQKESDQGNPWTNKVAG